MTRELELRRHTDNDGDVLTAEGVRAAIAVGDRLRGGYARCVSTGAQRATQSLACMLAGLGERIPGGVTVESGLRSAHEDRWRQVAKQAGGSGLGDLRAADPEFVDADCGRLAAALRSLLDALTDGERALVVGHSPTNEAAVLGLTGQAPAPVSKGAGLLVVEDDGRFRVEPLD